MWSSINLNVLNVLLNGIEVFSKNPSTTTEHLSRGFKFTDLVLIVESYTKFIENNQSSNYYVHWLT